MAAGALCFDDREEARRLKDHARDHLLQHDRAGLVLLDASLSGFLADHEAKGVVARQHDAARGTEVVDRWTAATLVLVLLATQVRVVLRGRRRRG